MQAQRGERIERNFAHQFDTGGMDRLYVRGIVNVHKKLLLQAAACNLALLLRSLYGAGKPRTANGFSDGPKDWLADGQRLLGVTTRPDGKRYKIWTVPIAAGPDGEKQAQMIRADPDYDFFQPKLSPDGRWICYQKVKSAEPGTSTLYVMPAAGGPETRLSDGGQYDDKPRWSPDGKAIYFLSPRRGFFNVWGIHFDSAAGRQVGEAFQVTDFESPSRMATPANPHSEMGVAAGRLALPITELSGNIWILENVAR